MDNTELRKCTRCKEHLPLSQYYLLKTGRPRSMCKPCYKEDSSNYYYATRIVRIMKQVARNNPLPPTTPAANDVPPSVQTGWNI